MESDEEPRVMTEAASQVMNWARELAVMTESQFLTNYNTLSATARKQLATFPQVKYSQKTCVFPWRPSASDTAVQERSPPITNASSSRDGVPQTLSSPDNPQSNDLPNVTVNPEPTATPQPPLNEEETDAAPVNRTRRRRNSDDSNGSYVGPRARTRLHDPTPEPITTTIATSPTHPSEAAQEREKVQKLLRTFGQKMKFQRYPDQRPTYQPSFETTKYQQLRQEQSSEEEEIVAKLFIQIKEHLALAYESESAATHHHFLVGENLVKLQERVGQQRFRRVLVELVMSQRSFRRYRHYYNLLSDFPRFKYSTISFDSLKDKIPMILRYFESETCDSLQLTDMCSKWFWQTIPKSFHNFDTIQVVNNEPDAADDDASMEGSNSEHESYIEDEGPLTEERFNQSTHWYIYKESDFPKKSCPICRAEYEDEDRIRVLNCYHQFHHDCVHEWLTRRCETCPTCRSDAGGLALLPISASAAAITREDEEEVESLSRSISSTSLNGNELQGPYSDEKAADWVSMKNARNEGHPESFEMFIPPEIPLELEGSRLRNQISDDEDNQE